mgnify:CR=1 FL=1
MKVTSFKPLRSGALDRTAGLALWAVMVASCFKPLRSGALDRTVQRWFFDQYLSSVSNPFVAGHWIVPIGLRKRDRVAYVSNPFVAGHWIVQDAINYAVRAGLMFQTPS